MRWEGGCGPWVGEAPRRDAMRDVVGGEDKPVRG
jgi:hypothetical protein